MNISTDTILQLIQSQGLVILFLLSIFEGPIVTVIGGWLAKAGLLPFWGVYTVCVAADLVGDLLLYSFGRSGVHFLPERWLRRIGLGEDRIARLAGHFGEKGGRTLVLAKWTHALGMAVLPAAGAARMPVPAFLFYNFVATLPKTLFFLVVGYSLGHAYASIDNWIWRGSALVVIVAGVLLLGRFITLRMRDS